MKCIINAMGNYITSNGSLNNPMQILSDIVQRQTQQIQTQFQKNVNLIPRPTQPIIEVPTAKKEKIQIEEPEHSFVTPVIRKTLTIIQPKIDDSEVLTPKRALSQ